MCLLKAYKCSFYYSTNSIKLWGPLNQLCIVTTTDFFPLFLFITSILFTKRILNFFSFLRKLQIFTLRIMSRATGNRVVLECIVIPQECKSHYVFKNIFSEIFSHIQWKAFSNNVHKVQGKK